MSELEAADSTPTHPPRRTDFDPKAARRVERWVSAWFGLSALMTILFVIGFVQIPVTSVVWIPFLGQFGTSNLVLGGTFGLAMMFIGIGAVLWARQLMNGHEVVQQRHPLVSSDADRQAAITAYQDGVADSGFASHRIIRRSMLGAMTLFPIPLIVLLRDLGPLPMNSLSTTSWKAGVRVVVDVTGKPIRPADVPVGGIISAMPANLPEIQAATGTLNARAKDVVLLVRMTPEEIQTQQGQGWDYQGILCFSKICTHVGCPIALYEQRSHHLLCPCHQSTFDLADSANVIFGPAARQLPQLPITVDSEGYIVAAAGFDQPVGPSFWERS